MLPDANRRGIRVAGLKDELIVCEMSARAYVDMLDARAAGKSEVEVSATVARWCVPEWREHSVDEIMETVPPSVLSDVMIAVTNMTRESPGESETAQPAASSSS